MENIYGKLKKKKINKYIFICMCVCVREKKNNNILFS